MPRNCTLKMIVMVNLMLCVFYHNCEQVKKKKTGSALCPGPPAPPQPHGGGRWLFLEERSWSENHTLRHMSTAVLPGGSRDVEGLCWSFRFWKHVFACRLCGWRAAPPRAANYYCVTPAVASRGSFTIHRAGCRRGTDRRPPSGPWRPALCFLSAGHRPLRTPPVRGPIPSPPFCAAGSVTQRRVLEACPFRAQTAGCGPRRLSEDARAAPVS